MRLTDNRTFFRVAMLMMATLLSSFFTDAKAGDRYNFNAGWRLALGDVQSAEAIGCDDSAWQKVTLPYAFNQGEAYSRNCAELSDTVMWYRKHFRLPKEWKGKRIYIEFEGARFGAHAFLNGHELGWADNGVMAFGFDLTPYILDGKDNVLAVMVDNDWNYHEQGTNSTFQWNNKNFYCNYGGLNKNVWLHVMNDVHQTLPLFSNLGTTGTYVYATEHDVAGHAATVNCESQVVNTAKKAKAVELRVQMFDADGKEVAAFVGDSRTIAAGDTVTLRASQRVSRLHFWSWGYGYLYTVKTYLVDANAKIKNQKSEILDVATVRTGFRKTEFRDGMFRLNDRVLQLKGFAQRSTNEWPALGISVPAWVSDYSNALVLGCNGNFFRWMHVTPMKQDVESFDRLGLIQALPAGDAEKDVTDRRWQQRLEVMRDAIIYNRNNPSVIFYEGGNNQISEEHMADLLAIRDKYDPQGGRAIGSRNMLDSKIAEYGGEMLYVNKSAGKPMWQMEYNRDEGIRRYWDEWSYPYHKEGEGPAYRGTPHVVEYNHNQDGLAVENIVRWNEYWMARPGNGRRVNSGGAKIIFSDSNTHARGEKNYRTSGDVDAMRIPKDSYFCHEVMWDGWVDTEKEHTYIIGHWNYENAECRMQNAELGSRLEPHGNNSAFCIHNSALKKPVYVCSTGDEVELFLNGRSLGKGERSNTFLFKFPSVTFEPGTLRAVAYKQGREVSSYELSTVGEPVALRMRWVEPNEECGMQNAELFPCDSTHEPNSAFCIHNSAFPFLADGADIRIAEVEAVDKDGRRHPLAHDMIHFSLEGEADYIGGISGIVSEEEKEANRTNIDAKEGRSRDTNGIGSHDLQLEAGVIRVIIRSTTTAGDIKLTATPIKNAECGMQNAESVSLTATTTACPVKDGFYVDGEKILTADRAASLPLYLKRGETPATPSYTQKYNTVEVTSIDVAVNADKAQLMIDDNEDSGWTSGSNLDNAWVKVTLAHPAAISQVVLRLKGFRTTSYPLQVYAGDQLVWEGLTQKCLGDCYLPIASPVIAQEYTIKMAKTADVKEAFGAMTELAAKKNVSTEASKSNALSIIEMSFNETAQ